MRKINRKELIHLIQYETGYSRGDISAVLSALARVIYGQLKLEPTRITFHGFAYESKEIPEKERLCGFTGETYIKPKHMNITAQIVHETRRKFGIETEVRE